MSLFSWNKLVLQLPTIMRMNYYLFGDLTSRTSVFGSVLVKMAPTKLQPVSIEPIYLKLHLKVLFYLGINIIPIKNSALRFVFFIYATILIGIMIVFTLSEALEMIINFEGIDKMTFDLCYLVQHVLGTVKMFLMIALRKKLWHHLVTLENGIFKPNIERGGIEEFKLIKAAIKLCNRQGNLFYTLVVIIVSSRTIYAALTNMHRKDYFDNELNTTVITKRIMPYTTWIPFEFDESPRYEMVFIFQIYGKAVIGFYIGAVDAVICGFMMLIKAQFLILKRALDRLVERSEQAAIAENDGEIDKSEDNNARLPEGIERVQLLNTKAQESAQNLANECVYHHQELIIFCEQAENDFCYLMLLQFITSLLVICFQLYQVSMLPIGSPEFVSMSTYLTLMLYQLLCYCWHGNEVALVSGEISSYVYNINWLVVNNSVKKSLLLIMMRSQRPYYFTAGKFSLLSLQTFMTIVRGAASYFMFLKQMSA